MIQLKHTLKKYSRKGNTKHKKRLAQALVKHFSSARDLDSRLEEFEQFLKKSKGKGYPDLTVELALLKKDTNFIFGWGGRCHPDLPALVLFYQEGLDKAREYIQDTLNLEKDAYNKTRSLLSACFEIGDNSTIKKAADHWMEKNSWIAMDIYGKFIQDPESFEKARKRYQTRLKETSYSGRKEWQKKASELTLDEAMDHIKDKFSLSRMSQTLQSPEKRKRLTASDLIKICETHKASEVINKDRPYWGFGDDLQVYLLRKTGQHEKAARKLEALGDEKIGSTKGRFMFPSYREEKGSEGENKIHVLTQHQVSLGDIYTEAMEHYLEAGNFKALERVAEKAVAHGFPGQKELFWEVLEESRDQIDGRKILHRLKGLKENQEEHDYESCFARTAEALGFYQQAGQSYEKQYDFFKAGQCYLQGNNQRKALAMVKKLDGWVPSQNKFDNAEQLAILMQNHKLAREVSQPLYVHVLAEMKKHKMIGDE